MKAVKAGSQFEEKIKEEVGLSRIALIRVPNAIKMFRGGSAREKSPFDFAAGIDGVAAFFEDKSTSRAFNFNSR